MGKLRNGRKTKVWSVIAALFIFVVLMKHQQAEADRVCCGVIRARVCPTTIPGQPCKRKFEDADAEDNTDQGYIDKPAPKCICREKTGTNWQTVLDIIKYGEQ